MNRAERRAAQHAGVADRAIDYCEAYRCPDCNADTNLRVVDGVAVLDVSHDSTCPVWQSLSA